MLQNVTPSIVYIYLNSKIILQKQRYQLLLCFVDVEKLSKMKKMLEILSTPSKRMPLETLLKCEVVLENMHLKRGENTGPTALREQHPLLEALNSHLQSPVINHTLQRTFGPCLEALFGSDIK